MKVIWFCLLVLSPLYSESFKVSSFNINFSNTKYKQTLELLKDYDADIILIQESTIKLEKASKKLLSQAYKHRWVSRDTLRAAGNFAVLSKWPITQKKFYKRTKGMFGYQVLRIELKGQEIDLIHVHLNPARLPRKFTLQSAFHSMMLNNKVQVFEIDAIMESVDMKRPTIIAGDFNCFPVMLAYKKTTDKGFTDAHLSFDEKANAIPTWSIKHRGQEIEARIDYIFHNDFFRCKNFEVVENTYSDHYLLNCELELKKVE